MFDTIQTGQDSTASESLTSVGAFKSSERRADVMM